jgi:hypothetical protein
MKLQDRFLKVGDTLIGKGAISFLITSISYSDKGEAVFYELSNCKSQHFTPFESHSISIVRSRPILCSLEEVLKAFDDVHRFFSIFEAQKTYADRRLFLIEKSNLVNCGKSSII